jgi:hypothetical protein
MLACLKKAALFALAGCFLLGFGFVVWSSNERQIEKQAAHTEQRQTNTDIKSTRSAPITDANPTTGNQKTANPTNADAKYKKKELEAIADTAFWTKWIVFVAGGTAVILIFQSIFLGGTVYLTRINLIAAFRPKLGVRWFRFHNDQETDATTVTFTIVNRGGTRAKIVSAEGIVYFRDPSSIIPYDFDEYDGVMGVSETTILAGGNCTGTIKAVERHKKASAKYSTTVIYAAGRIRYRDDIGNLITTAFLRQLDSSLRFRPVGDDNYEYQD